MSYWTGIEKNEEQSLLIWKQTKDMIQSMIMY